MEETNRDLTIADIVYRRVSDNLHGWIRDEIGRQNDSKADSTVGVGSDRTMTSIQCTESEDGSHRWHPNGSCPACGRGLQMIFAEPGSLSRAEHQVSELQEKVADLRTHLASMTTRATHAEKQLGSQVAGQVWEEKCHEVETERDYYKDLADEVGKKLERAVERSIEVRQRLVAAGRAGRMIEDVADWSTEIPEALR